MTAHGAIVGRPAPRGRAGEERDALLVLARERIPVLGTVSPPGTFEAADALWLGPETLVVGVGVRTNGDGARQVAALVERWGVQVVTVPLRPPAQHLLGLVNVVSRSVAGAIGDPPPGLAAQLDRHGVRIVDVGDVLGPLGRWALNVVGVDEGVVVAPAGAPALARRLGGWGVEVVTVEVGELIRAAGGPACATGILRRGDD